MTTSSYIPRVKDPIARRLWIRVDVWIVLAVLGLLSAGMLGVYSASYDIALRSPLSNNDPYFYITRQSAFFAIGLFGAFAANLVDYHTYRKFSIPLMAGTVALLAILMILSAVGGGEGRFGAARWFLGGSIQPSEVAKLMMILYTSHWLSTKGNRLKSIQYGLIPFGMMVGIVCLLILLQPNVSTSLLIALISFTLFFLGGADIRHFLVAIFAAAIPFILAVNFLPYVKVRILDWQQTFAEPLNAAYQLKYSVFAISSGSLFGKGIGMGEIKYILPVAHSDFIFSVWSEELGFIGSLFIIGSFMLLAWRGVLAAQRARDMYGYLLAMGVTCWISYQAIINIAVVTLVIPATGMPLPFMSYGGSSMVMTMIGIGILLNVSRDPAIGRTLKPSKSGLDTIRETTNMRRGDGRARVPSPSHRGRVAVTQRKK